jgi:Methyltransferase domain
MDFEKIDLELPLGWFSSFDMACIYPALKQGKKDDIYLEIGVDRGKSLTFARRFFKGDVFGIDPVAINEVKEVDFINKESNEAVKDWTLPIKVLFIDGDHSMKGVKDDWDNFSPFVVKGGWVFFHDSDSGDVEKFVKDIKGWKSKKWYKKPGFNTGMSSVRKP